MDWLSPSLVMQGVIVLSIVPASAALRGRAAASGKSFWKSCGIFVAIVLAAQAALYLHGRAHNLYEDLSFSERVLPRCFALLLLAPMRLAGAVCQVCAACAAGAPSD